MKIFQNIRQRLVDKGNLKRYLLYAFGEIILVMVGILLALQVNNWNEVRKNKVFEKEILAQIRVNLIKDRAALTEFVQNGNRALHAIPKLLDNNLIIENNDSIKYWLADIVQFNRFYPLTNAYDVLKSKGLDLISNKALRFLLGTYYDDESNHMVKSFEDIEYSFMTDWIPILKENLVEQKFKYYLILENYDGLKKGGQIRHVLIMNKDNWEASMMNIVEGIALIDRIIESIDKEIQ